MEHNPLQSYFRQPTIYLTLPSGGKYYPNNTLEHTETQEFPVFAMTAKDELAFKTPDALLNGQATVDVIKSCVPNITNPWFMPSLDLDAVLIAIRIATYGTTMELDTTVPVTQEKRTYQLDLRETLDNLIGNEFDDTLQVNDLTVHIRPLTYQEFTKSALKTFEEQRVFSLVNNEQIGEEEKLAKFAQSFKKLTELTIGMVVDSIVAIEVNGETVDNKKHITEFLNNADKDFYNAIIEHVEKQKQKFAVKPLTVATEQEDREQGAPETFEVPIVFDQANFFG